MIYGLEADIHKSLPLAWQCLCLHLRKKQHVSPLLLLSLYSGQKQLVTKTCFTNLLGIDRKPKVTELFYFNEMTTVQGQVKLLNLNELPI